MAKECQCVAAGLEMYVLRIICVHSNRDIYHDVGKIQMTAWSMATERTWAPHSVEIYVQMQEQWIGMRDIPSSCFIPIYI